MSLHDRSHHYRTCNLCEATCGIVVETSGTAIAAIHPDEDDPLSQGHICPKAYGLKDTYEDPDRLRRPLIKDGASWREAGWSEAVTVAARGIHELQSRHGQDAVASYIGNPTAHNLAAMVGTPAWLRLLGGHNRFSASTVDQFPKMLACYLVYGAQLSVPIPDIDRNEYLLVLGANPVVSNGSLMTAPGMKRRLRELRQRGGRVVVVDPRRSETAAVADEHFFIRPGSDPVFLLALLATVFEEDLVKVDSLPTEIDGLEHVAGLVAPFTAERAEAATSIAAADIRRIARELAASPAAACYARIGTCLQSYGTLASYLVEVLNIVTGSLGRTGGVMFPQPAASYSSRGSYKRWSSRIRGLPEFGGELPVAGLAEEIETAGEGAIHGLFTMAGNPVLSTPNGHRLERALEGLEFMVSVDPYLNETTRHARVILPPRHSFMNDQYSIVFHKLAVRDTAKYSRPVFEPGQDDWSEWEILAALCAELSRLRSEDSVAAAGPPQANPAEGHFSGTPVQFIEMLLAGGPYELTLKDLMESPSGIDLGPLKEGGLERGVRHEDGRIRLAHDEIDGEVARLGAELEAGELGGMPLDRSTADSFLMIGRRQLRSNNSWMHNCPSLMTGPERCTLLMHPADASRLGFDEGRVVSVESRVGRVELPVSVTDEVMEGVVSMPHGYGHGRPDTRMGVANEQPGVSMNDLTDELMTEGLVGNGVLTGVPVRIRAS